ncbi:MAG TPA: GDSL-type esterase/lipase family protein [Acidobacteriaceae bacterium]|nr:GDSL-type esterase/lipase family protein [Acidobacteriaceae bacterium]
MKLLLSVCSAVVCAGLSVAAACAAPVSVHQVAARPSLHPLAMSVGGRMLITSSPAGSMFGRRNYTYQWPGSYFRAEFEGNTVFFRIVAGDQILHVRADGHRIATLVKPTPGVYEIEGLGKGVHRIGIYVATESQGGTNTFGGIAIPRAETGLTLPRRQREIEFIGDSHTVGYGDLSTTRVCSRDKVWTDTDDTSAFGPLIARHYGADYQVNAISGRGVVRNYDGFPADTLPEAYPWILFDKKQKYRAPSWKPQVLVIALGTNDFSTPLNPGERWKTRAALHADFEATYLRFLQELRTRNPHADMIVWATEMANGEIEAEARKVVDRMKKRGDTHITFVPIDGLSFTACDSHPSLADEKTISGKIEGAIDSDPQLWQKQ